MSKEALKNLIKERYKNREKFSVEVDVSLTHLTRILNNREFDYNFTTILKIAKVLNINILYFILEDEKYLKSRYKDLDYFSIISKNVKELREKRNLSQKRVAQLSQISLRTYSSIEGNKMDNLKVSTIIKLNRIFKISLKNFLFKSNDLI
ncbi:helix-turn-helix domain-containing protein [Cetobacterium sp.]|uniref:helix-turn-helix domain-containing protein n=1 Tax=Cetobacterium sp. TaxID=2071632 RepID=UPI003F2C68EA